MGAGVVLVGNGEVGVDGECWGLGVVENGVVWFSRGWAVVVSVEGLRGIDQVQDLGQRGRWKNGGGGKMKRDSGMAKEEGI